MPVFYFSFCTEGRWHGGAYVEAPDELRALAAVHSLGLRPEGECEAMVWPAPDDFAVPPEFVGRLLDIDDLRHIDLLKGGEGRVVGGSAEQMNTYMEAGEAPPGSTW